MNWIDVYYIGLCRKYPELHLLFEWSTLVSVCFQQKWTLGISLGWTASITFSISYPGQSISTSYWPSTSWSFTQSCPEFCCFHWTLSFCPLSPALWTPWCCGQRTSSTWTGWGQTMLMCLDSLNHLCITNILASLQIQTRMAFSKFR